MSKDNIEAQLEELAQEETQVRRLLEELENRVQSAPGSHSPGVPSRETMQTEREIQGVVLRLSEIDRKRQELTVARSLAR